jgi:PAS domain S-box-containing protein
VASALAFRNWPAGTALLAQADNWIVIAVFLLVALLANALAGLARSRALEADRRREEADLAAELARRLLRVGDLRPALDTAAQRVAQVLGLPSAALELDAVPQDENCYAVPLDDGATTLGTLVVPADLSESTKRRLHERVIPALEAIPAAERQRDADNLALESSRTELTRFFDVSSDLLGIAVRECLTAEPVRGDGLGWRPPLGPVYFTQVNRAFEQTLGYSSWELRSCPFLDFVHPADRDRMSRVFDDLGGPHGPAHFEHRCLCRDGSERWLEWNVAAEGGLLYAAARDVTDRRREQERLREAQQMIVASRDELSVLAEQQAALRRVATLVACGVPPSVVFSAVAEELARCLGVYYASLWRYEPDGAAIALAAHNDPGLTTMPVGERISLESESVAAIVFHSGRPARMGYEDAARGSAAARLRDLGVRSAAGSPIVVDGRVWGAAIVGSARAEPLPPDTEARVGDFAELVATAIASAQTRADLAASRARIVAAADDARRRFERDLHDGAQQRLVLLGLQVRTAEAAVPAELEGLKAQIYDIATGLAGALEDLQQLSRGMHPAILSMGGLGPALKTLARRSAVPVELDIGVSGQLSDSAEVAAYYVVAEALTNAAKHAQASVVHVNVEADGTKLVLSIRDDGVGGADSGTGSGLIGLIDRVEALGGQMQIASPAGNGTLLRIRIPFKDG